MEPSEEVLTDVIRFAGAISKIKEAHDRHGAVVLSREHVQGLMYGLRLLAVKPQKVSE